MWTYHINYSYNFSESWLMIVFSSYVSYSSFICQYYFKYSLIYSWKAYGILFLCKYVLIIRILFFNISDYDVISYIMFPTVFIE